jgi:hypothetical protein
MTRCCKIKLNPMIWSVGSIAPIYFCANSQRRAPDAKLSIGGRQVLVSRLMNLKIQGYGTRIFVIVVVLMYLDNVGDLPSLC